MGAILNNSAKNTLYMCQILSRYAPRLPIAESRVCTKSTLLVNAGLFSRMVYQVIHPLEIHENICDKGPGCWSNVTFASLMAV